MLGCFQPVQSDITGLLGCFTLLDAKKKNKNISSFELRFGKILFFFPLEQMF